jgi:hypothetical protein
MRITGIVGALAFMTITLIGAFSFVDRRAAEALKAEPLMIDHDTRATSTANARSMSKLIKQFASSRGTPASTIASTTRTGPATVGAAGASSLDADEPVSRKAHHRRRWHHRR